MKAFTRMLLAVCALFLVACTTTRQHVLELGVGYDEHIDEGTNPMSVIRYRNEPRHEENGWIYEFDHHSSYRNGWPFNDRPEDLVNQHSLIYRWVF